MKILRLEDEFFRADGQTDGQIGGHTDEFDIQRTVHRDIFL